MLECSTTLPPALLALIDASTVDAGVGEGAMAAMLLDLELKRSQWSPAKVARADLEVRYPKARFLVNGPVEPGLVVEGDVLLGALMPLKP